MLAYAISSQVKAITSLAPSPHFGPWLRWRLFLWHVVEHAVAVLGPCLDGGAYGPLAESALRAVAFPLALCHHTSTSAGSMVSLPLPSTIMSVIFQRKYLYSPGVSVFAAS